MKIRNGNEESFKRNEDAVLIYDHEAISGKDGKKKNVENLFDIHQLTLVL